MSAIQSVHDSQGFCFKLCDTIDSVLIVRSHFTAVSSNQLFTISGHTKWSWIVMMNGRLCASLSIYTYKIHYHCDWTILFWFFFVANRAASGFHRITLIFMFNKFFIWKIKWKSFFRHFSVDIFKREKKFEFQTTKRE